MTSIEKAQKITTVLDSKKAEELNVIGISGISSLADYFVIATGTSGTHVKALADEVEYQLREQCGISPLRVEGYRSNTWILLDYENVIVHVFTRQARSFYDLDRLWKDGEVLPLTFLTEEEK